MANDVLKHLFQAMHSTIAVSINPDSVMDALFSKNVIGSDDYYRLRQVPVSRDRCREMLSILHTGYLETSSGVHSSSSGVTR